MKRLDNYVNMLKGGVKVQNLTIGQYVTVTPTPSKTFTDNSGYVIGFLQASVGRPFNNVVLLKNDKTYAGYIYNQFINLPTPTELKPNLTPEEITAGRSKIPTNLLVQSYVPPPPPSYVPPPPPSYVPPSYVPPPPPSYVPPPPSGAAGPPTPPPPAPPGTTGYTGPTGIPGEASKRITDPDTVIIDPKPPVVAQPSKPPVVATSSFYDSGPVEPTYFKVSVYKTINGKDTYVNSGPAYPQDTIKKILDAFKVSGNICIVSSGKQFVKSLNGKDLYTTLGQLHLKYESVELFVL